MDDAVIKPGQVKQPVLKYDNCFTGLLQLPKKGGKMKSGFQIQIGRRFVKEKMLGPMAQQEAIATFCFSPLEILKMLLFCKLSMPKQVNADCTRCKMSVRDSPIFWQPKATSSVVLVVKN